MDLSIIIVNYNVKYFTAVCLYSVEKAVGNIESEIWVVDNASTDGSVPYLQSLFPAVKWIINKENKGFGAANNQAAQKASGNHILLLNPDTIIAEDTLIKCLNFIKLHPDAGALGVHMISSQGKFLKESKRGFPSPAASFYKMAGLANLFPRSKKFAHYYQGHLAEWENSKVEVLSGAFMLINKEVWDITGGFDEDYFMYGEDIDLSYRILQAGFYNYYFPGTTIVHFKGESSREKDARYIRMFYQAMNIFVHKHMKRSVSSAFIAGSVWCMSFIALAVTKITRIQRQSARLKKTTGKNFLLVGKNILTDEWHKKLEAAFKTNQINVLASEPTILSNKWKGQIDQPFSDIIFFIGEMTFINVISYMETRDGSVNYLFLLPFDKYLVGHHIVVRLPDEVLSQNPVKQTDI